MPGSIDVQTRAGWISNGAARCRTCLLRKYTITQTDRPSITQCLTATTAHHSIYSFHMGWIFGFYTDRILRKLPEHDLTLVCRPLLLDDERATTTTTTILGQRHLRSETEGPGGLGFVFILCSLAIYYTFLYEMLFWRIAVGWRRIIEVQEICIYL